MIKPAATSFKLISKGISQLKSIKGEEYYRKKNQSHSIRK